MFRVRTQFTGVQGSPWLSTFFFNASTYDSASAAAAASATGAFWTSVKTLQNANVNFATLAQVDVIDPSGTHSGAFNTTPVTGVGGAAGIMLPSAVQGLCQWRTGTYVNSREVRGRTYIPGLTVAAVQSGGLLASATSTAIQSAITTLLGNATAHLAVWDRKWAGGITVASGSPWSSFAVLRSRRD